MKRRAAVCIAALLALAPLGVRAEHPGTRTGVLPETITIGLHVPLTGASPVDAFAIQAGASLYWRHLHDDLGTLVHGRRVEVVIADDTYTPSTAVQVCNDMAATSFVLLGFTGTDQINACAGYAEAQDVPYASPGAQEMGLSARSTYYALSPSFPALASVIAEFVAHRLLEEVDKYGDEEYLRLPVVDLELPVLVSEGPDGRVKVGLVRPNTPNFNDLETRLRTALEALGQELIVYPVFKEGTPADAERVAAAMKSDRVETAVVATGAITTLRLANYLERNDHSPRMITFGQVNGHNGVGGIGCSYPTMDRASSFSPWPGWAEVMDGAFDPAFADAAENYAVDVNTESRGDLLLAMWGLMKDVHAMLEAAGPDPTREDFNAMMDAGFTASTGVYPDLAFEAGDPFGASAIHRLELDCDDDATFHQADAFVSGYPPE